VIRTHELTKRFGSVLAVDHVDLDVREGDIYGFLGANGSGKTTSVRLILGLVLATAGEVELLGEPMPRAAQRVLPQVGTLVEGPSAYPHLSARANLEVFDAAGGRGDGRRGRRARVTEALERVGLGGVGRRPVKAFSLGMKQRLGLARALLRTPRLVVLDEPTNGLDPQGIREIRELLQTLNAAGTTVFLSSHQLSEVEQLCTRVGVLDRGRLVLQNELAALREPTGRTVVTTPDAAAAVAILDGRVEMRDGERLIVKAAEPAEINRALVAAGLRVSGLAAERRTLEEVILEATSPGSDRVPS
jgi:ABC-2 type transport system ATP-binding protein